MRRQKRSRIGNLAVALGGLALAATLAHADIAVVVSPLNPVVLDKEQIGDLFMGKKTRFPDASVAKPVDQPEERKIRNEFYALLAGKDESDMKAYWSVQIFTGNGRPPKTMGNDGEVIKFVKENAGGIGYIDSKQADSSVRVIFTLR